MSFRLVAVRVRKLGGFTLVELLAVLLIIGLLLALLVPIISGARDTGRRTECLNRIREIAHAIGRYETNHHRYPGYREFRPLRRGAASVEANWVVPLIPDLGRRDIFDALLQNTYGGAMIQLPSMNDVLVCPADQQRVLAQLPDRPITYVVNGGRLDNPQAAAMQMPPVPADWPANGVFLDRVPQTVMGVPLPVAEQTLAYIRSHDGLQHTLLLSENLNSSSNFLARGEATNTFLFWPPGQKKRVHEINGPREPMDAASDLARPSSNHAGGVNVVFAGGNADFISQSIDYWVYCQLMTPHGAAAKEPGTTTPSDPLITNPPPLTTDSY
jgi:prepilin-type N-terminal cleavage/methylation domain-containing protein